VAANSGLRWVSGDDHCEESFSDRHSRGWRQRSQRRSYIDVAAKVNRENNPVLIRGCLLSIPHPLCIVSQKIRTIRLKYLAAQLSEVAYQITKVHFSNLRETDYTWRPEINVFQCATCFRICVELAGVDPGQIEITIASGHLWVRGYRVAPEPLQQNEVALASSRKPVRVITMEIDHGLFEREVEVPAAFDTQKITTEWDNGLLWIFIPRKAHA
jgi:HSP20 family protein